MKIPEWLKSLLFEKPAHRTLICMRLTDMVMVHPKQIERSCSICGETVGIYPSGQALLEQFGDEVDIVCQCCAPPGGGFLAPGAESEPQESVRRDGKT